MFCLPLEFMGESSNTPARCQLAVSYMSEVRNVIIIGSGPAGYTAGLYAGRAMLNPLMFAGYMSGGQLMLTSDIENFPGYPEGIGGPEMMMQLREQAERFGLEVEDRNVDEVDLSERPFKVMGLASNGAHASKGHDVPFGHHGSTHVRVEFAVVMNDGVKLFFVSGVEGRFVLG